MLGCTVFSTLSWSEDRETDITLGSFFYLFHEILIFFGGFVLEKIAFILFFNLDFS